MKRMRGDWGGDDRGPRYGKYSMRTTDNSNYSHSSSSSFFDWQVMRDMEVVDTEDGHMNTIRHMDNIMVAVVFQMHMVQDRAFTDGMCQHIFDNL